MAKPRDRKDMLLKAGLTLASELSLPIVLQRIVDLAAEVTDARYGALGVIGEGDWLIEVVTTGIPARQRQAIGALPAGRGVLGLLIHQAHPVRIKNIADHPQSVGFPANHPPMSSFLGAPVQAIGRVFGNIYLAEKRSANEFSQEDEDAVVILAAQAGDLAGADAATVVTRSSTPAELKVAAAAGARAAQLRGQSVPTLGSISGAVMSCDDVSQDARAFQPIVSLGRHGPAFYVPLRVPGGVAGTLMVANLKGGKRFSEETRRLVASLADAASVALDYDRAQSELRRLGLLEERERIAKELHDGVIQSLFAVGMSLQGTALTSGNSETSTRLEHAVEALDGVIRDLRNYIFGLRPGILADHQLDQALRNLGEEMQSRTREQVDVSVDAALAARLSSRSADIVQLTREALSNIARHAHATRAAVRLEGSGKQAVLVVTDDGIGFHPENNSAGNGLRNMRERAAKLGGSLEVTSVAGKGTTLRVAFPV